MKGKLFNKNMKLAEMVHTDFRILYILPRLGIQLGFGEATLADICQKLNIHEELLLLIINIYTFDEYTPTYTQMSQIPLEGIMDYLKHSHRDYLHNRIPHIINHIQDLTDDSHTRERDIVKQFCENYKNEVIAHFKYEEETVFPYINALIHGSVSQEYNITQFSENHTNLDDKLNDLKNIILKYIKPSKSGENNRDLLIDLFLLEEDLKRHTMIEDKILVALVAMKEQHAVDENK